MTPIGPAMPQIDRSRRARRVPSALLAMAVPALLLGGCALLGGSPDLSGWTSVPTTPDPEFAAVAQARCESFDDPDDALVHDDGTTGPVYKDLIASGHLVQDQRGPNGASLLWVTRDGEVDSFAYRDDRGRVVANSCGYSSGGSGDGGRFRIGQRGWGGSISTVQGPAPAPITRVEVTTESGLVLDATVGQGRYLAWWPGGDIVASARAFDADGQVVGVAVRPDDPDESDEPDEAFETAGPSTGP